MAANQGGRFEQWRRPTRHEPFLAAMERIVPWQESYAESERAFAAPSLTAPRPGAPVLHGIRTSALGAAHGIERTPIRPGIVPLPSHPIMRNPGCPQTIGLMRAAVCLRPRANLFQTPGQNASSWMERRFLPGMYGMRRSRRFGRGGAGCRHALYWACNRFARTFPQTYFAGLDRRWLMHALRLCCGCVLQALRASVRARRRA